MKKLLSILVIGVVAAIALPASASAAFALNGSCERDQESCVPDENGYCYSTCTVYVENNTSSLNQIDFTLDFVSDEGVEIIEMNGLNGWTVATGTSTTVSVLSDTAVTDARFDILEYRIRYTQDTNCSVRLILDGASTVTITHETTTEVETGATLPIAILACGVAVGAVIYVVTKKNKKLYKI